MSLNRINVCIVIPTYNNQNTLQRVVDGVLKYSEKDEVIVVDDGSTDGTASILRSYGDRVIVLSNPSNRGKGFSLRRGFREAIRRGYSHAITIDSDGQHYPEDIPEFIAVCAENPDAMIMGSRNMDQPGVPGKSSFGNKFSNFWFKVETGLTLPDTQTGFRLYPLEHFKRMKLFTTKFETEIEIIVRLAWKNVKFIPISVNVLYDPIERVSHFRPFADFARISLLNTVFVFLAVLIYWPGKVFRRIKKKGIMKMLRDETLNENESNLRKAASIGFGVFMGILPIWGFQLLVGIPLALILRMNKVLFLASANISVPPMIPPIVFLSYYTGGFFISSGIALERIQDFSLEAIHLNFAQYALGASVLALVAGLAASAFFYVLFLVMRKPAPGNASTERLSA